jgi:hypothetical protein
MAVSDTAVRDFLLANPNLTDAQIVDAMKEYNVTPTQLSRVTGVSENEVVNRASAVDPQVDLYAPVQQALQSKDLTQEQFNNLSAYFGNEMTLNEASRDPNAPTIKSYVKDPRSGYEFATFLATRGAEQGGNETAVNNFANLVQPYIGQEVGYTVTQPDSDSGQTALRITDPVTGREVDLQYAGGNTYRNIVASLSGRESGPESSFFSAGVDYQLDPNTGRLTIKSPYVQQYIDKGDSGVDIAKMLAGAALTYFGAPVLGDIGTAVTKGLLDEATGGDFLSGFGSSLIGNYAGEQLSQLTGGLGPMDYTSPDYIDMSQVPVGIDFTAPINYDILSGATFPSQGLQISPDQLAELPASGTIGNVPINYENLLDIAPSVGLQLPTSPGIPSMGGAQGLTFQTPEGTFSQAGLTPTGATPTLGDASSFINDPDVLGQPVIQEYAESNLPGVKDVLRAANTISKALTPVQQQTGLGVRNQQQQAPAGVDYSSLLALLQGQARTPNVASLLG